MQHDAITSGQKVVIIDDLVATGGELLLLVYLIFHISLISIS